MKKFLSIISVATLITLGYCTSAAADIKIAVIDLQQILQKSPQISTINKQLSDQFKPRQEKIVAAKKSLDENIAKLEKEGAVMSISDKSKLQDKIINDKANLQGMAETFQKDVNTAQAQSMQKFSAQLADVLNAIAKEEKYDLILQKQGVPYADEKLNITAKVINALAKK